MPISPLPPDILDLLGWFIVIVIIAIVAAGLVLIFLKYIPSYVFLSTSEGYSENVMKELLNEIRLLRKEIEELRRELKE